MSKEKYIFQVPPTLYGELKELKYKADKYDKYKEIINKAIDKLYCWGEALDPEFQKIMLDILKEVE